MIRTTLWMLTKPEFKRVCNEEGKVMTMQTAVEAITKEDLFEKIKNSDPVQVVNVLGPEGYELGLIKGSIRIPLNELGKRHTELNRNREVVTYCANYECPAAREAAQKLMEHGFKVRAYEGGINEWKEAGLPFGSQGIL